MGELKNMYLQEENFSNHLILEIAAKLYFLMKNIASKSESYRQFLLERTLEIKERKKLSLNPLQEEEIIIHTFMNEITSSVEIVNGENKAILSQFVKAPETFFLTNSTRQ